MIAERYAAVNRPLAQFRARPLAHYFTAAEAA